jgi:SAM-dependent methyltransferase
MPRGGILTNVSLHNRQAWDREVLQGNPATIPLSSREIQTATGGLTNFSMTGGRIVPEPWLKGIKGSKVLCLALGGGQQVPLLAAAGAVVTSVENSPAQLQRDKDVAAENNLKIDCVLADMQSLDFLGKRCFDRIFIGLGLQFIESPSLVWGQAAKLLPADGQLIAALVNPVQYIFEWPSYSNGEFRASHPLPYSDIHSLTKGQRQERFDENDPIEFGHTFQQLFGDLCEAGFSIHGFMEDTAASDPFSKYMATYFVINAKLR